VVKIYAHTKSIPIIITLVITRKSLVVYMRQGVKVTEDLSATRPTFKPPSSTAKSFVLPQLIIHHHSFAYIKSLEKSEKLCNLHYSLHPYTKDNGSAPA
jgi:hypothetical protein